MKTSIIPIFIPHIGCPYRCVFCNQWKITGHHGIPGTQEITAMINSYTKNIEEPRHWELAFYGGSFTAIDSSLQETLLQPAYEALQAGKIAAIRCSTRPDCIDETTLKRLQRYGLRIVELGVQSMDNRVLQLAKRGHTADQVSVATTLLRQAGFTVGHQLMPGLPGEDWLSMIRTTAEIIDIKPDMVRIYPVAVIAGTELADMYLRGDYEPLSIHEGVMRAAYMKQRFSEQGIPCIRTGLQATEDLNDKAQVLAGAYTPAMGEMVDTKRYQQQLFRLLATLPVGRVVISYHRTDTSRVRGIRNVNVHRAALCCRQTVVWQEDMQVKVGTILVKADKNYTLHINSGTISS